jgi:hypothetical protein
MSAEAAGLRVANLLGLVVLPFLCGTSGFGLLAALAIAAAAGFALILIEEPRHARLLHRRDVRAYVVVRVALGLVAAAPSYWLGRVIG